MAKIKNDGMCLLDNLTHLKTDPHVTFMLFCESRLENYCRNNIARKFIFTYTESHRWLWRRTEQSMPFLWRFACTWCSRRLGGTRISGLDFIDNNELYSCGKNIIFLEEVLLTFERWLSLCKTWYLRVLRVGLCLVLECKKDIVSADWCQQRAAFELVIRHF